MADPSPPSGLPSETPQAPAGDRLCILPDPAEAPVVADAPAPAAAAPAAPKAAPKASPVAPRSRPTRERKQVSRLTSEEPRKKAKLEIKAGAGAKLGDIPNVAFRVGKFTRKDDFLKKIHNLLYRKPGAYLVIKRNILDFSGFTYAEASAAAEVEKDTQKLLGYTVEELNLVLDTFDLPRGKGDEAKKEGKVKRILDFLSRPKVMSDKDLAAAETKKKLKRKRATERRKKKKASGAKGAKKKAAAGGGGGGSAKKAKKKPAITSLGDESSDEEESGSGSESESESDSSGDDLPLVPVKKGPEHVNDASLKKEIASILKTVDLSAFSLKDMMKQLSAEFGGADLKPHKPFIKEQVALCLAELS